MKNHSISKNRINTNNHHNLNQSWNRRGFRIAIALILMSFMTYGCGHKYISTGSQPMLPKGKARIAILPLENLTNHLNAGLIGAELLLSEIHSRGRFAMTPFSEVRAAIEQLDISRADQMTNVLAQQIGEAVSADLVMTGAVVEYGYQFGLREEPSVSMNLRLVRVDTGDILWSHSAGLVSRGVSVSMVAQSLSKKMVDALLSK